jgi:hypothetical protein
MLLQWFCEDKYIFIVVSQKIQFWRISQTLTIYIDWSMHRAYVCTRKYIYLYSSNPAQFCKVTVWMPPFAVERSLRKCPKNWFCAVTVKLLHGSSVVKQNSRWTENCSCKPQCKQLWAFFFTGPETFHVTAKICSFVDTSTKLPWLEVLTAVKLWPFWFKIHTWFLQKNTYDNEKQFIVLNVRDINFVDLCVWFELRNSFRVFIF